VSEREPIARYYAKGFEQDRLSRGIGAETIARGRNRGRGALAATESEPSLLA
jgi:hypothetical protein